MTLNINRLNAPIQRDKVAEMIQKQDLIYAAYKRLTSDLETQRLKVRGWRKVFQAKRNQKKAGAADSYETK